MHFNCDIGKSRCSPPPSKKKDVFLFGEQVLKVLLTFFLLKISSDKKIREFDVCQKVSVP
jgi:hypothetical protein